MPDSMSSSGRLMTTRRWAPVTDEDTRSCPRGLAGHQGTVIHQSTTDFCKLLLLTPTISLFTNPRRGGVRAGFHIRGRYCGSSIRTIFEDYFDDQGDTAGKWAGTRPSLFWRNSTYYTGHDGVQVFLGRVGRLLMSSNQHDERM